MLRWQSSAALVALFFAPGADIGKRNAADVPPRYLDLYDARVRKEYSRPGEPGCADRLQVLSNLTTVSPASISCASSSGARARRPLAG
jgi:hypothetical protein